MEFDDDDQVHFEAVIKMVRKTKDLSQEVGKKAHYCILEQGVDAICLLIKKDDVEAQSWYTFSMTYTSEFLLRMFCQAVGDDQYLYFISEKFNCTLNHWTSRSIWDYNTDRLNRKFAHILLCIMQGIVYLHKKAKTRHGKVSADSVYIVKGDAKLGNVLNTQHHQSKNFRDDYNDFANLVENEFKRIQKTREIPYELKHFIKAIKNTNSISEFRYQMNHPVLLTPERRCHLRNDAKFASNNQSFLKNVKSHVDVNLGYNTDWRSRVELTPECLHIRSLKSYKKLTGNAASNFFLLSRNACNHVNDVQMCMKEEELDRVLNRIWPEFLCKLFDALYRFNIKLPDLWNLESN